MRLGPYQGTKVRIFSLTSLTGPEIPPHCIHLANEDEVTAVGNPHEW